MGTFGWDEPSTTIALDLCKKYVLTPYHILLKMVRPLKDSNVPFISLLLFIDWLEVF